MTDEIKDMIDKLDTLLDNPIHMSEPNSIIEIFKGIFSIRTAESEIEVEGLIEYRWFPTKRATYQGKIIKSSEAILSLQNLETKVRVIVNKLDLGESLLCKLNYSDCVTVEGVLKSDAKIGDITIPVDKIKFSIPNMRDFGGLPVVDSNGDKTRIVSGRLIFNDEKFKITIDKVPDYISRKNLLDKEGGYLILYNAELIKSDGNSIKYSEAIDVVTKLGTFLSFLCGRRISGMFLCGIYENKNLWKNFARTNLDLYQYSHSWAPFSFSGSFNAIWLNFSKLWRNEDDRDFLKTSIHWYLEANKNSGFTEGSLIMAQTALELLYNWFIVENKKLIIGKDAADISAANKIRLLVSQLNIDYSASSLPYLQEFIEASKTKIDAPEAIVQIRNAIVHSQEEKRKNLIKIDFDTRVDALRLCLWYIEMSLLKILQYDDYYQDRRTNYSNSLELVPWQNHPKTKNY